VSDDVVFDHSAWPATMRGRAEVRVFGEALEHLKEALARIHAEVARY
jgi:hypothetical protein